MDEARRPYLNRPKWPWVVAAFEVKCKEARSAFSASSSDFLRQSKLGRKARVQLFQYALTSFQRQHRTHLFEFSIAGTTGRVLRWDRSGCVVTTPIDLEEEPELFLNCLFRLARLGRAGQGFDSSVHPATRAEINRLREYTTTNDWLEGYKIWMLANRVDYPIYKVSRHWRLRVSF